MGEALDVHAYVTEATLAEGSPAIDETIAAFGERHDHDITVTSILRAGMRSIPLADTVLRERDTLILGGEPDVLERVISRDKLALTGQDRDKKKKKDEKKGSEIGVIEAVVNTESPLIGQSAGRNRKRAREGQGVAVHVDY